MHFYAFTSLLFTCNWLVLVIKSIWDPGHGFPFFPQPMEYTTTAAASGPTTYFIGDGPMSFQTALGAACEAIAEGVIILSVTLSSFAFTF